MSRRHEDNLNEYLEARNAKSRQDDHGSPEWLARENSALAVEVANAQRRIRFLRSMIQKAIEAMDSGGMDRDQAVNILERALKSDAEDADSHA